MFSQLNYRGVVKITNTKEQKAFKVDCETPLRTLFSISGNEGEERVRCMAGSFLRHALKEWLGIKEKDKHSLGGLTIVQACSAKGFTIQQMLAMVQQLNDILNGNF